MGILEPIIELDRSLFFLINGCNSTFLDGVMYAVSDKFTWIPLYLSVVYLFFKVWKRDAIWIVISALVCVILSDQISAGLIKNLAHRLRPSHIAEWNSKIHLVREYAGGLYGFVSSHAANSFAFALFSSLVLKNRFYTVIIFTWAILLSYSRVYLGVHYPLDVVGGAIVGLLLALSTFNILLRLKPTVLDANTTQETDVRIPLIVTLSCFSLILLYSRFVF
jgi:undecaprenyl-diphosphatase